jgi:hypothetical protein
VQHGSRAVDVAQVERDDLGVGVGDQCVHAGAYVSGPAVHQQPDRHRRGRLLGVLLGAPRAADRLVDPRDGQAGIPQDLGGHHALGAGAAADRLVVLPLRLRRLSRLVGHRGHRDRGDGRPHLERRLGRQLEPLGAAVPDQPAGFLDLPAQHVGRGEVTVGARLGALLGQPPDVAWYLGPFAHRGDIPFHECAGDAPTRTARR